MRSPCRPQSCSEIHNITKSHALIRINLPLFSTVLPSSSGLFLSCRPFVVMTTFSTDLVSVYSVSWLGQLTEVTSTPTRPVDNVVIATKGLQDRNTNIIAGTTVENKGKLIQ